MSTLQTLKSLLEAFTDLMRLLPPSDDPYSSIYFLKVSLKYSLRDIREQDVDKFDHAMESLKNVHQHYDAFHQWMIQEANAIKLPEEEIAGGKKQTKNEERYPSWVCRECAASYGGRCKRGAVATFHPDICDVCNKWKVVTEPRDYGHPDLPYRFDKEKILQELRKARNTYDEENASEEVEELTRRIEKLKLKPS